MIFLVVEDEPLIRLGVRVLLEEAGHEAFDAATGRQALQILDDHHEIELLLTDFRMPGITGLDLVAHCRRSRPDLKIILMTGYSSMDHIFPDDCPVRLVKPFSLHDLSEAIETVSDVGVLNQSECLRLALS